VSLLGIALLYTTLCKFELTAKHSRAQLRALRRRADRTASASADAGKRIRGARSAAPTLLPTTPMTARTAGRQGG